MKKILLAGLVMLLAAVGYWYYQRFTNDPKYALLQAANAVRTHDITTFERYVDVNSVTGSIVDGVTEQETALSSLPIASLAIPGALRMLKPQIGKIARQEMRRYVATGTIPAATDAQAHPESLPVLAAAGSILGPNSTFKGIKYVREDGSEALVGLEITQPRFDTTIVVELKMQNQGDYWQVKEITNTGALLKQIVRLQQ